MKFEVGDYVVLSKKAKQQQHTWTQKSQFKPGEIDIVSEIFNGLLSNTCIHLKNKPNITYFPNELKKVKKDWKSLIEAQK